MPSPLIKLVGRELAKALPKAGVTVSATLTRLAPGTRTPGALANGTNPTSQDYPCKGFVSTEIHEQIGDTLVESTDRVVCLLGATLEVTPRKGDRVTIDGESQRVESVEGSAAMWTVLLRG